MLNRTVLLLLIAVAVSAQNNPAYRWVKELGGTNQEVFSGLGTDAAGNVYVVGSTRSAALPVKFAIQDHLASPGEFDLFISKLDPDGNVLYSTYFGGNADDQPTAMTVDAAGNVYITGTTYSSDFPSTKGAWKSSPPLPVSSGYMGSTFVMRINSDGMLGFSTFFTSTANMPNALAVDAGGSIYISGASYFPNDLPVTPGAYGKVCGCGIVFPFSPSTRRNPLPALAIIITDSFLARFDATGSNLIFATYLSAPNQAISTKSGRALAVAADGSTYLVSNATVFRVNNSGSALLSSFTLPLEPLLLTTAPDASVYVAGIVPVIGRFATTPGALLERAPQISSVVGQGSGAFSGIVRLDPNLSTVLAATYFGSTYGASQVAISTDAAGNIYLGGGTSPHGLPTVTPLSQGFGSSNTGYVSKISGDLKSLLFSSYFGDSENFSVGGLAIGRNGDVILGGLANPVTTRPDVTGNAWLNSISVSNPPALRVDSVVSAASLLADPLSAGETIVVRGTGFGADARVWIGETAIPTLSADANNITVVVPKNQSGSYTFVEVRSDTAASNRVLVPVESASPGIYSQDGTGYGQGYILNQDGSLNSPSRPANYGDRITVFATGAGLLNFTGGYAVTATPVRAFIDGFYCFGVAAVSGPVAGLPGDVYQLTVYVPTHEQIVAVNQDLTNFKFPAQSSMVLNIGTGKSQNWLTISIAQ